jgi:hypothetical protein
MSKCIKCGNEISYSLLIKYQQMFCYSCFSSNVKILNEESNNIYHLYKIQNQKIVENLISSILENEFLLKNLLKIITTYINYEGRKYYTFNNFNENYQLNQIVSNILNNSTKPNKYGSLAIILFSNQDIELYKSCYPSSKIIILF